METGALRPYVNPSGHCHLTQLHIVRDVLLVVAVMVVVVAWSISLGTMMMLVLGSVAICLMVVFVS